MLTVLRRLVSGWVGKLVLGLMLGVFAIAWTIADGFSGRTSPNTVLSAGGTSVSLQDYQVAYQQALARVSLQLQRRATAEEAQAYGVDQATLSQLATSAVLDEQGRRLGLGLSEEGLLRLIAEDPGFQDGEGRFSRDVFRLVLNNAGLTEAQYIDRLGNTALRQQIVDSVAQGVGAPETLRSALGLYLGETRDLASITVRAEPAETIADPSDEALATFFEAEAANYAAPEYRALQVVQIDEESLVDPTTVTDEAVADAYETERSRFTTAERRAVRQIVFADQAAAETAAAQAAEGATFDEIATSAGIAPVDIGLLAESEIPDANIAEAAFTLPVNGVSGAVSGIFGPVVLTVTSIEPEGVRPLEEVREDLREDLALDAAADRVEAAYEAFENARSSGSTFAEAATEASLPVQTVDAVDAQGLDPEGAPVELPVPGELLTEAFSTQPGFDNPPVTPATGTYVFFDVTSITDARDRPLEEVRDRAVADWKEAEAGRLLDERITALEQRLEAGETLDALAAAEGLELVRTAAVTRDGASEALGEAGGRAAFAGPVGSLQTAPAQEGGATLILRAESAAAPAAPTGGLSAEDGERVVTALQNDLLQSYVEMLREEYPVRFNEAAIQTVQSAR